MANAFCSAIAVDSSGNAFVTGEAQSPNFPTTLGGNSAASGNNYSAGSAIAIDSAGHAYVDAPAN